MALIESSSLMTLGLSADRARGMARHSSVPSLGARVEFNYGRPNHKIKGSDSLLRPVKDKVRAAVKNRRLRLEEFFQPFDVTRTKKVSEASFIRAMNASGIDLSREELGMVLNRYRVPAGGAIDYQRFCDQCNKVFTSKGLEREPTKTLVRTLERSAPHILGVANPTLTASEKARTADMMEDMRRNVRDASLVVKNLFSQYDHHAKGCVSGEQFLRVISCHSLLSADKVLDMKKHGHVLVKAFTERVDGSGLEAVLVNYKALHHQLMVEDSWVNNVVEPQPALLVDDHPEEYNIPDGGESPAEILARLLVEEAVARRIEVMDYFCAAVGGSLAGGKQPGAGLIGLCSRDEFKQLLKGLWRTHFTDEQADALASQYIPTGHPSSTTVRTGVDLTRFARRLCSRVSEARKRAAASEQSGTRPGGGGTVAPDRLSAEEKRDVNDLISDIRGRIRRERIILRPAFKNFDPRNELVVANEQFARVLSAQGLLPTNARLRELLTRRYGVSDFRRQTTVHQGFVAYLEFLKDVDVPVEMETQAYIDNFVFGIDQRPGRSYTQPCRRGGAAATSTGAALKSAASHTSEALMGRGGVGGGPARSCDAVIRDVRGRTARERVRMLDLFKDFDRLGHGTCTQAQLSRVMKTLDHALTDGELAAVCRRYQSKVPWQRSSGDGTPLVVYKNLVADIEAVFTVDELEKLPATTKVWEVVREARGTDSRLRGESSRLEELSPEEEGMVTKFLRELAMKVNKESLCLPTLFTDYDKLNVGDITEAGMERALGGACLLPPEPIFRALVKKFREHSRQSSGGEVNCRAFLAAVELAQNPLETPRDLPNATKFRAMRAEGAVDAGAPLSSTPGRRHSRVMTPRTQESALRSALVSVGQQLRRSHCQLEDFLADDDHLKTGEVTGTSLRHCLVLAGVRLTTPELVAVDKSFRSVRRPETIAWQDFCKAAVDAARGLKDPDSAARKPTNWKEGELLMRIEGEIKARDPNLEALFKGCDKPNHGNVTEAQFFSLLNQGLPRIHLTAADTDVLTDMFVDRSGCDFGGRVRYKTFLEAVCA